jgi:hypothetical protein
MKRLIINKDLINNLENINVLVIKILIRIPIIARTPAVGITSLTLKPLRSKIDLKPYFENLKKSNGSSCR